MPNLPAIPSPFWILVDESRSLPHMGHLEIDIIVPCYNPPTAAWADQVVAGIHDFQAALGEPVAIHLILVNDGSSKGMAQADIAAIGAAVACTYISYQPNAGKGHALRKGVAQARGMYQLYTDVDFPYEPQSMVAILKALQAGADVAAGVRDQEYYRHVPPIRKLISKVFRACLGFFLRLRITDTQCGLKGFNAKGRAYFLQTRINRFLFDLEFIFLASADKSLRISPVDVRLRPEVTFSKARLGILLRESLNFTWIILRAIRRRILG